MVPVLQVAEGSPSWPEAMIAVGGIAMVTIIAAIAIWQVLASWRARMSVAREDAYRKLAEEAVVAQRQASAGLERATSELTELRKHTAEMERLLKEVG